MDQNGPNERTKLLVNNEEIDNNKGLGKIKSCMRNFFNNLFHDNSDDAFPYKSKVLEDTFWCAQILYTRIILVACFFSFVVAWNQNAALIGEQGLTPAKETVARIFKELQNEGIWKKFQNFHSLFWFLPTTDFVINLLPLLGIHKL
ncbi:rhoptry protein ROP14 (ROP14) [Plasmodium ovale wallikeri]|uniref:Rhoptry protein ROP14 (ROP14) n=1 Tax=Plasmodium ovale wallikeri TaxID=864142 RepID=A0A1A8Z4M1_PLAOA|nr:rhoptry protein ROP14 (ROP14) [Plasmodium ovale wallikeri]SBT39300.1 rhoptry protein ROP14 (ROP14) [Plasmodium ovale wallikeri]